MYPLAIIEFEKALDSSDLDLFTDYALGIACRYEGDSYQALDHFKKSLQVCTFYLIVIKGTLSQTD